MFYLFLLAHLVADFILQPLWLVQRKKRWDGLLIHGGLVLLCMALLPLAEPGTLKLWPAMLGITIVHIAADWWKVRHGHKVPGPPIVPFMLDQVIHVTTLIVALSLSLSPELVWSFKLLPSAHTACVAAAYVVAAFAAPIAVMVWLDPRFEHVALAGRARLRCLVAGAMLVSLVLFGGVLALPAALLGLAIVARHPLSAHPLDMPAGMLAVMSIAGSLGALLVIMPT